MVAAKFLRVALKRATLKAEKNCSALKTFLVNNPYNHALKRFLTAARLGGNTK